MAWQSFGRRFARLGVAAALVTTSCGGTPASQGETLVDEAGFLDVPAAVTGPRGRGRMFYSFHPADHDAAHAPVVVLFNGGPGIATTLALLPYGTGPFTLVADPSTSLAPKPNDASWTRFANVLYLDARSTGFSYELGSAGCHSDSSQTDAENQADFYVTDAGDFIHALLDFLDAHPSIRANRVVLSGESYGGTRGMLMMELLMHYAGPIDLPSAKLPDVATILPWAKSRIQQHVDAVMPSLNGKAATPDQMNTQFGQAVFIEPGFGLPELAVEQQVAANDPVLGPASSNPAIDSYDVRQTAARAAAIDAHTSRAMRDPDTVAALLGVALSDVKGLAADERGDAVRSFEVSVGTAAQVAADEKALRTKLGALGPKDAYWLPYGLACSYGIDEATEEVAVTLLPKLRLFITRARYDLTIHTAGLVEYYQSIGLHASIDEASPKGAARPGELHVVEGSEKAVIRFPEYDSGHEVTLTAGPELADDVEAWMRSEGFID